MSVNIFGDGTQIINSASAQLGNTTVRTFTRTLGNALNDAVNICRLTMTSGACVVDLSIVQSETNNSIAKVYRIPIQYNSSSGGWRRLASLHGTGGYNNNDFEVDVNSGTGTATLRLVRTAIGASPNGANITCSLQISQSSINTVTIVDTNTASSAVTNGGLYAYTPISATLTNVGIGTSNPTEVFQVVGKAYVDTQILGNSNDSASNPSFTFKENSNTGMFHPVGTDILGFSTSGTERVRINETGAVGIGTTAPAANTKLHVAGHTYTSTFSVGFNEPSVGGVPSSDAVVMYMEDGVFGTNQDAFIIEKTDGNGTVPDGGIAITRRGNNGVRTIDMTVKGGNVGIGVLNPGQKLDVTGSIRASSQLISTVAMGTAPLAVTSSNLVTNLNADFLDGQTGSFYQNPANLSAAVAVNKGGTGQTTLGANKVMVGNGTTAVLTPTNLHWDNTNSRLGIGTALPGQTLHVVGDTRIQGNLTVNGTTTVVDTNSATTEQLSITNDGTGPAVIVNQTGAQPIMRVQDDGVTVFEIADGGNVGIGTSTPTQNLEIVALNPTVRLFANGNDGNCTILMHELNSNYGMDIAYIGNADNKLYIRAYNNNFTPETHVTIERATGNVGIGTTTPSTALQVAGTVTATTFSGALSGNATTATTLQTARTINGVSFNGSANINVNTVNTLTRGTYLTGANFNGSAATTWAVDATTTNTASKVVARDASGGFSAGAVNVTSLKATGKIDSDIQFLGQAADTLAAPSFSWTTESNTGIYRPNTSNIGFVTLGTEVMRVQGNTVRFSKNIYNHLTIEEEPGSDNVSLMFRTQNSNSDLVCGKITFDGYTDGTRASYIHLYGGCNATLNHGLTVDPFGNVGVGTTAPGQKLDVSGTIRASSQLISTVATGTAPLAVSSTTLVTNLNSDLLDGLSSGSFFRSDAANSVDVRLASGNGRGMRFWDSDAYKIFMSAATDATWGGRVTGETTSDYNIYFRIGGGTNRGFVFQNGSTSTVGFDASGNIRCTGHIDAGTQFYGNSADTSNAPGYTWDGDTNVGMYRPEGDTIGFTCGGVERVRITSAGRLGVGTTAPTELITIASAGTTDYHGIRFFEGGFSDYGAFVKYHNGDDRITIGTTNANVDTNAINVARTTGYVGILTATPAYQLDVNGIGRFRTAIIGDNGSGYAQFSHSNFASTSTSYAMLQQNNGNTFINCATSTSIYFRENNVDKMIYQANKFGIMNNAPTYTLDVTGDVRATGDLRVGGHWYWSPIKNIYCTATAVNQDFTIDLINQGTYTGCTWQVWSDRSNTSVICARGDTYNVGIYNATPDCRLVVNGTMKVHDGTTGVPAVGTNGGTGTRIVLWPGSGTEVPYALGITGSTMWRSVPSVAIHSWYIATTEQMRLNTTGLGIGTTAPSYKLHVNGDIYATSDIYAFSDCNYKENIHPIPHALEKVSQLQGYTYSWKDDSNHQMHAGLLAQEVEKVLPEVINHDQDGKMSVAYGNMVALLIQAINEQNKKIEAQQQMIEALEKRITEIERKV